MEDKGVEKWGKRSKTEGWSGGEKWEQAAPVSKPAASTPHGSQPIARHSLLPLTSCSTYTLLRHPSRPPCAILSQRDGLSQNAQPPKLLGKSCLSPVRNPELQLSSWPWSCLVHYQARPLYKQTSLLQEPSRVLFFFCPTCQIIIFFMILADLVAPTDLKWLNGAKWD